MKMAKALSLLLVFVLFVCGAELNAADGSLVGNQEYQGFVADLGSFKTYEYGQGLGGLNKISAYIRANYNSPGITEEIEQQLIGFLESDATLAGKQFVCKELCIIGTGESVKTLAGMLDEPGTYDMALYVLKTIDGCHVDKALQDKLSQSSGSAGTIGIINTLALRGYRGSVSVLAGFVCSSNPEIAEAAIDALGEIGGAEASQVLAEALPKISADLRVELLDAWLECADGLAAEGSKEKALDIYRQVYKSDYPVVVRAAALAGLVGADSQNAGDVIIGAIKSEEPQITAQGLALVGEISDAKQIQLVFDDKSLSDSERVQLLGVVKRAGKRGALAAVTESVKSRSSAVRLAALGAMETVGDESVVMLLAKKATASDREQSEIAHQSLCRLRGNKIDKKILANIPEADLDIKIELIRCIGQRQSEEALATLLKTARDEDQTVRTESYKALQTVAAAENVGELIDLLIGSKSASGRKVLEKTIAVVAAKTPQKRGRSKAVLEALPSIKEPAIQQSIIAILGSIGDDDSVEALRGFLKDKNEKTQEAALRAMAGWPSPAPMADMLDIVKEDTDPIRRVLAMRAYAGMLCVPANRRTSETVKLLTEAMTLANSTEEKKAVLSVLPKFACLDTLKLAQAYLQDAALAAEAKLIVGRITEVINNRKLTASASSSNDRAGAAVDGNAATRWDTGRAMQPGDWFMIDMGIEDTVKQVVIDTVGSGGDYARGCEVYVSYDGGNWGKPILEIEQGQAVMELTFDKGVHTRFIKIVQTGKAGNFWSIHEISVVSGR